MSNDGVAKLPLHIHETRRRSDGHADGVAAVRHRADAIFPKLKFGKLRKQTLSQHHLNKAIVVDGILWTNPKNSFPRYLNSFPSNRDCNKMP